MTEVELHVQIWNDKGELVVDKIEKCMTATQAEIDEMVGMIESGTPAHLAAKTVKQGA